MWSRLGDLISLLGLRLAAYYGGGTNDNTADTHKEICTSFEMIMDNIRDSDDDELLGMLCKNGVERCPIAFGGPFHIANLCVTWASIAAFGETENADHSQVHHRQLLQSIHSLHSADSGISQALLDEIMDGATRYQMSSKTRMGAVLVGQSTECKEDIRNE